jgi:hypothetical protein
LGQRCSVVGPWLALPRQKHYHSLRFALFLFTPSPFLPSVSHEQTFMNEILKVIELNRIKLLTDTNDTMNPRTRDENMSLKTRVLLIRSCLSTLGAITTDLSAYFHPYIPRVIQTLLPLMTCSTSSLSSSNSSSDFNLLVHDTQSYLTLLVKSIPKRLCIPALVQVTPSIFKMGHEVSYFYFLFLKELWVTLERNDVTSHANSLQTLCQHCFEYREMYERVLVVSSRTTGAGGADERDVDDALCDSVIEICLKYTEKELKSYLLKLYQWTEEETTAANVEEGNVDYGEEWYKYCRCKIFFQFVSELEKKLQSIFVPLMSLVWVYGSEQIGKYIQYIQQHTTALTLVDSRNSVLEENGKNSKKRKRKALRMSEDQGEATSGEQENSLSSYNPLVRSELHETSRWILESVRLCCVHDNIHFIDQVTSLSYSSCSF